MSSRETVHQTASVLSASIIFLMSLRLSRPVDSRNVQDFQNNAEFDGAAEYGDVVQKSMDSIIVSLKSRFKEELGFCLTDIEDDWNSAFNYSENTDFLLDCAMFTQGDMPQRLCTSAEIQFYLTDALASQGSKKSSHYMKPNTNCNLTSWIPGCEPGWACSANTEIVDMQNSQKFPPRTANCGPCCEGFFCPKGLTCMIPCPLGSYCPLAKLNPATALCDPYSYQIPPGKLNHTCGGADAWADIQSSGEVFCTAGSYCPSTIKKFPCSSGYRELSKNF